MSQVVEVPESGCGGRHTVVHTRCRRDCARTSEVLETFAVGRDANNSPPSSLVLSNEIAVDAQGSRLISSVTVLSSAACIQSS